MATKSMGTLTLNLVMQMGGFEQGADRAERALNEITKAADRQKAELMRLLGQIDPVVAEYDRLVKAGAKLKSSLDAGLIDQATFTAFNNKLAEQRKRLDQSGDGFVYGALSAKQYQQALRGMPAQITDLVVSLQAGQNPMTVFLQQGGQIKDMFGGIGPAIAGMSKALLAMVNPVTVGATAVATLGLAIYHASEASSAFEETLAITGNRIGATNDELRDMAKALSGAGNRLGEADIADVMNLLVRDGAVAKESIGAVSEAIAALAATGVVKADDLTKAFSKIAKDPVGGVVELSRAYGNFLTPAVLAQIAAAKELGDQELAIKIANEAAVEGIKKTAIAVEESTNAMERGFAAAKGAAVGLWRSFYTLFEDDTLGQQIAKLEKDIAAAKRGDQSDIIDVSVAERRLAELKKIEQAKAAEAKATKAVIDETIALEKAIKGVSSANALAESSALKARKELAEYNKSLEVIRAQDANSPLLDPKTVEATRKRYQDTIDAEEERGRKMAEDYVNQWANAYGKRHDELKKSLSDSEKEEVDYLKKISGLRESIGNTEKEAVDKVRALRRQSMSEDEASADMVAEIAEKMSKAQQAAAEGRTKEAESLVKHAESIAAQTKNTEEQIRVIESGARTIITAKENEILEIERALNAHRNQMDEVRRSLDESERKLRELDSLVAKPTVDVDIDNALNSVDSIKARLEQIQDKTVTVTVVQQTTTVPAAVEGFATGGRIHGPGTGTSDSILANVSAGEYVLREASAKSIGYDTLDYLNRTGALPGFSGGGLVDTSAVTRPRAADQPSGQGTANVTIQNLNLPKVSNAKQFIDELQAILRTNPSALRSATETRLG